MKICFLDSNPIDYNANDLHSNKIRGAETALYLIEILEQKKI